MDIKKLQTAVIDALEDVKAQDIRVFDTVHLTSMFDRLAIASGTSNRQTKALAASVRDKVKEKGGTVVSIEGEETGEWVLVDLGDMVVHIMQPAIRDYYRLEEIWGEKEVKFGAAKRTAKKTAADEADGEAKPARKRSTHVAASQTTLDDDEPKKPARKTAARKTTATKTTATKTAATKTAATKSAATKTTAARKTAAKTPVGKTVKVATAKTAAPRKTAAKRTTAK
ncbi:ribosome silencing factor [Noviherbaspirillum denitrificans]|uniref:Ribosomal silencing factor RsfS n=1 Tax=Noviherbaspirillum denitrificans TaxID=1968433 RepID=A0A254TFV7_9BURK|nr:ribosome silencing factor [Noviherbaspirillum denitrificans]OWW21539.1 ribosome silencing factor RsfS [Noviherbaspirillum denitrificans]